MHRSIHLALCLNRDVPTTTAMAHRYVRWLAKNLAAIAIANPAQLRQANAGILLIEREFIGTWNAKRILSAFFVRCRKPCSLPKEVCEGPTQILQRLLQSVDRHIHQPRVGLAALREFSTQGGVWEMLPAAPIARGLQFQSRIVNEATRPSELHHLAGLFAARPEFKLETLPSEHGNH